MRYPPPPPPDLGPPAAERHFGVAQLAALRHGTAEAAERAGLDPDRAADAVLAVNEIGTNAAEHGPGDGRLRLWTHRGPDAALVAEVADDGRMDVPFPGMTAPPRSGARGRGLWLASEPSDVLQVWSGDGGTIVRLRFDR